ncbi:hypothetical protein I6M33_13110 [Shewanella algae]|uniref:hypothetical protein n=1 Tax=Shewanella algae TaxID=38313 RepID=UPI001AAC702C|nr:hypothetical protein [Shewanella algae]MBO2561540.1 hypothetical protein [Shewanella algae]
MSWFNSLFIKKLKEVLDRPNLTRIPRSGPEGEKVDCFSVYVTDREGSYLAAKVKGNFLIGQRWDEETRSHVAKNPKKIDLTDLDSLNFDISHYHGLVTYNYKTPLGFLLNEVTHFYVVRSKYILWKYNIPRFFYNKRRLKRPTRLKALAASIKLTEDNHNMTFDCMRLVSSMFGSSSILHPQYPTIKQGTHLVLMSLAESGELEKVDSRYFRITGKALSSYEHLLEEKHKERRSRWQSRSMLFLTLVLALTAAFQSKLLRTTYYTDIDPWIEFVLDKFS